MVREIPELNITCSPTGMITKMGNADWHLEIPSSDRRRYRVAQLDDHGHLQRGIFPWRPPLRLSLYARVSTQMIPGTWGFGLWNDPFSFLIAYKRMVPRFLALPDAAWFFHASPQNYLSFRDDLPANGFLAATFSSKKIPTVLLMLASPILALTLLPGTAQVVRRLLRGLIQQDACALHTDVTDWHEYRMDWDLDQVSFYLDEIEILRTRTAPSGPLSLVIWVDNRCAALPSQGRLVYGTLPNPEPAWLEIRELSVSDKA